MKYLLSTLIALTFIVSSCEKEPMDITTLTTTETKAPEPVRQKVSGWFTTTTYPDFSRTHNSVTNKTLRTYIEVDNDVIVSVIKERTSEGFSGVDDNQLCYVNDKYIVDHMPSSADTFTSTGGKLLFRSNTSGNSKTVDVTYSKTSKPNTECVFQGSILTTAAYNGGGSTNDQNDVFWFRSKDYSSLSNGPNHYVVMNGDLSIKELYFSDPVSKCQSRLDLADYDILSVTPGTVRIKYNKDPSRINQTHLEATFHYPINDSTHDQYFDDNVCGELPDGSDFFTNHAGTYTFNDGQLTSSYPSSVNVALTNNPGEMIVSADGITINGNSLESLTLIGMPYSDYRITSDGADTIRWDPFTQAQGAHAYYYTVTEYTNAIQIYIKRGNDHLRYNYQLK